MLDTRSQSSGLERLLEKAPLSTSLRERVRRELQREEHAEAAVPDVWLLRAHPGSKPADVVREARLVPLVAVFASTYVVDYSLFVLSWWLVGRGALRGHIDMGWLYAWALLFVTMLPFRSLSTWHEGRIAASAGALLKQRLLLGAMRLAPDEMRADGAGRHLARVFESEAVESLALTGGFLAAGASIEIVVAIVVLALGAGGLLHALLLVAVVAALAALTYRYYLLRKRWTDERLAMSHDLVERMVGHRTRLAQQDPRAWHEGEDAALASYAMIYRDSDRLQAWSLAMPRIWLPIGLVGMALPFVRGTATLAALAVGLGGMILASRGLTKLTSGLSYFIDAAVAWRRIVHALRVAERSQTPGDPSLVGAPSSNGRVLLEASDLAFRYPTRAEPVLRRVRFALKRGDRVLLTSPSGGGKSTLVSLVNGLRDPAAGLLLLDGVDRRSLGNERWTRLVATAPQFHENHVFTESFAFNLLMGRRWPPSEGDLLEAEALCRELGLGALLDKMPGGMNQLVGDTGWQLSHGEKSRLYLARALLQGGELTMLDESFAALDPDNLRQALLCARGRARSLLVIAHV